MIATSPGSIGRRLFALGFQLLFLELALIRFLPGYIWNLGYFPNLVLLAAFIGFGFGFLLHRRLDEGHSATIYHAMPLVVFSFLLLMMWLRPQALLQSDDNVGNVIAGELYWTNTNISSEADSQIEQALKFMFWFGGVVVIFFMLGQHMAKYFAKLRPLKAYSLDIAGSLLGIVAFMVISYFQISAAVWFLIFTASFIYIVWGSQKRILLGLALVVGLAFSVVVWINDNSTKLDYLFGVPLEIEAQFGEDIDSFIEIPDLEIKAEWSPYQRVSSLASSTSGHIFTNGIAHQVYDGIIPFELYYFLPHSSNRNLGLKPFKKVLIIGAGSGNDVFAALRNGARRVVAVEIDPTIAKFGYKDRALENGRVVAGPYHHPFVELVIDDGRHYLYTTEEKFDLIVFALTDSLVKVSPVAQLRLENYLFTDASFARAAGLLAPGGWLVLYNYYRESWLVDRYQQMLEDAMPAGAPVLVSRSSDNTGAENNPWEWSVLVGINPGGPLRIEGSPPPAERFDDAIPTDDWPFPYVKERTLAPQYLFSMLFMLALVGVAFVLGRHNLSGDGRRVNPWFALAFMMMGTAFLLLETKGVIQFSLLFGTTWYNNSFVFFGVLTLILLAIRIADKVRSPNLLPVSAVLLIASAMITLALPLELLLGLPGALRFTLACLLMFTPIFFANLIFSVLFRDRDDAELYFGWNLLGATLGGVLEYLSVVVGYQALGLVVVACYGIALGSAWMALKSGSPAPAG